MAPLTERTVVAIDLDGTIDAAPLAFEVLMRLLQGDGVTVVVLTGNHTAQSKLAQLGVPQDCYDQVVILPGTTLPTEKAAWCTSNQCALLIDNKHSNCLDSVAAGVPLALRPVTSQDVRSHQVNHLKRAHRLLDT